MNTRPLLFLLLTLPFVVVGCQPAEEESEYPTIKFEGSQDERFVGVWKNEAKSSTYWIKEDGTYHLEARVHTGNSNYIDTEDDGEWKVNKDKLLFKDGLGNVAQYVFEVSDSKMVLDLNGKGYNKTELFKSADEEGEPEDSAAGSEGEPSGEAAS